MTSDEIIQEIMDDLEIEGYLLFNDESCCSVDFICNGIILRKIQNGRYEGFGEYEVAEGHKDVVVKDSDLYDLYRITEIVHIKNVSSDFYVEKMSEAEVRKFIKKQGPYKDLQKSLRMWGHGYGS